MSQLRSAVDNFEVRAEKLQQYLDFVEDALSNETDGLVASLALQRIQTAIEKLGGRAESLLK